MENALFNFATEAFLRLAMQRCVVTLENPTNSLFWKTSWFALLKKSLEAQSKVKWQFINMQMCMHGE